VRLLAHVSDLHFGTQQDDVAEALLAALTAHRPDLIVVSGDLTQRARTAEFLKAKAFLGRLPAPFMVVPGNHDIPLYDLFSRLIDPFAKYRAHIGGDAGGFFADDEIAVLGLNTVRRLKQKNGRVSPEQMAEIAQAFGPLAEDRRFRIVVTHHPVGLPGEGQRFDLAGRASLALAAMAAAGVRLVLSGHHHRATSGRVDAETSPGAELVAVYAGTALSSRTRLGDGNSFNLVRVEPGRLGVTVVAHALGSGFMPRAETAYRLTRQGWMHERLDAA